MNRSRRSLVLVYVVWGLGAAVEVAAGSRADVVPHGLSDHAALERAVRVAYESYSLYALAGGAELELLVSDVETHSRPELEHILYGDIVTPPGGSTLAMAKGRMSRSDGQTHGVIGRWFDVEWIDFDGEHLMPAAEWEKVSRMPLSHYLALLAAVEEDYVGIEAVTAYRVEARLGGKSRTYRAAFLWAIDDHGASRYLVHDNVVRGIAAALDEAEPPVERPAR